MKIYYHINDICVCCGAPVDEGTMVCQQCIDKVEKADKLSQTESYKTKNEPLETGKKYKLCAKAYLITVKKKTGAICSQNGMT